MKSVRLILKMIIKLFLFFLFFILSYFIVAYVLQYFPKKETSSSLIKNRAIYLLYSDMHTDIVFNINEINRSKFPAFQKQQKGYLTFGWGDKETYLNTPTWNDLKLSTAMKALLINTPSLMHVSYSPNVHYYKNLKKVQLTLEQYRALQRAIFKSFDFTKKHYKGYGKNDFFYTAKGSYNLFNTCNTWTGRQLREVNVSVSYWTPLSINVIDSLP
jgi:uncharacterized protein (TIGR02117 family)